MRRTETVPPGGRWRAYLARRVSIPWMGVVLGLAVPLVGAGGGRLRFVLTMLVEVCGLWERQERKEYEWRKFEKVRQGKI